MKVYQQDLIKAIREYLDNKNLFLDVVVTRGPSPNYLKIEAGYFSGDGQDTFTVIDKTKRR